MWDFDGTLFDTRHRNLSVTRAIVSRVLGHSPERFPVLSGVAAYDQAQRAAGNWRHFYQQHLGLDDAGTDHAGRFWVDFQLEDQTEIAPIEGVVEVIEQLRDLPQGIVSQNSREVILQILGTARLEAYFSSVIGHAEVPMRRQKPEPDGILLCLEQICATAAGTFLFIGDHEIDTLTAHNANDQARREGLRVRFISVAAAFHEEIEPGSWAKQPDFVVRHPSEIPALLGRL